MVIFSCQLCHVTFSAQRSDQRRPIILQHYHSLLHITLRCCFSFLFCRSFPASCINAAIWWKTSSGWFHWLFPPLWLKVRITEISCSGFSEWNKIKLQTHNILNKSRSLEPHGTWSSMLSPLYLRFWNCLFPHGFILFMIFSSNHSSYPYTAWQVSWLTVFSGGWMPHQTKAVTIVSVHQTNLENVCQPSSTCLLFSPQD